MTTYTGDLVFYGDSMNNRAVPYYIYNSNVIAGYIVLQTAISFVAKTFIPIFNSIMLEEYVIKSKCSISFFGQTCWYQCIDSVRIACNCVFMEVYTSVPCNPVCKPGIMF